MRDIDEIKRLAALGLSKRQIARALGIHRTTITKCLEAAQAHPPVPQPVAACEPPPPKQRHETLDWPRLRDEIVRGVPINIVYEEEAEGGRVPVQYPAFWKQLQKYAPSLKAAMVRVFTPGDRTEIDYCEGIDLVDVASAEVIKTEHCVGVLCSSRYAFAEFTLTSCPAKLKI